MARTFTATTSDSLAAIGDALFNGANQNALDESVQMTRLLESLSKTNLLDYPIHVEHTREQVPDFQIQTDRRKFAVELTKITNQNLGHAKAIHRRGEVEGCMTTAQLIGANEKPLPKSDIIQKAFCIPQIDFGPDWHEECNIWKETALKQIERKSECQSKNTFQHGDEDWLVLLDELGTLNAPMLAPDRYLLPWLHEQLRHRWKDGWFSRLFIQSDHFFRTWMLTREEVSEIGRLGGQNGGDLDLDVPL